MLELGLITTLAWLDVILANENTIGWGKLRFGKNIEGAVPQLTVEWSFNPACIHEIPIYIATC